MLSKNKSDASLYKKDLDRQIHENLRKQRDEAKREERIVNEMNEHLDKANKKEYERKLNKLESTKNISKENKTMIDCKLDRRLNV